MVKVSKDSVVYVFCPKNSVTGGAELLHQLVYALGQRGISAFIVYFDPNSSKNSICNFEVPDEYKKYQIRVSNTIEENDKNIVVLYEAIFDKVGSFNRVQFILWWLSVDNFYYCSNKYLNIVDYCNWNKKYALRVFVYRCYNLIFKGVNYFKDNLSLKKLAHMDYLNCYQSEYAQYFLSSHHFKELLPLKDFINDHFFEESEITKKENIVLYNPKKGWKFTRKIIEQNKHLTWIPLTGMTREEMIKNLKRAKLYIDFGYHPGKDRIPREAAMSGACIITGRNGSAAFFEDVSIFNQYKIDNKESNIAYISKLINDILINYDKYIGDFLLYRDRISSEKQEFFSQVASIFKIY